MIILDYRDRRPIYEQIVERFQELMVSGVMEEDSQLPSVRSLAMELSINPNTIQKAFSVLEQEGYIFSVKGRGNFVSESASLFEKKKGSCLEDLRRLLFHAKELGILESDCTAVLAQVYG